MTQSDGGNGQPEAQAPAPQLRIVAQYVKDFSFENPNAPRMLTAPDTQPAINVHVDVRANQLPEENYEIELRLTVDAKAQEQAMFMVDLLYGGIFRLQNIPADSIQPVLLIECPRQIFPFARRIVADVTRDGGFPPLMIDPIDFAALYRHRMEQAQAEKTEAGSLDA